LHFTIGCWIEIIEVCASLWTRSWIYCRNENLFQIYGQNYEVAWSYNYILSINRSMFFMDLVFCFSLSDIFSYASDGMTHILIEFWRYPSTQKLKNALVVNHSDANLFWSSSFLWMLGSENAICVEAIIVKI